MLELNTLKSEKVDWLQEVLDYGKRFPEVKLKDFGLNFTEDLQEDRVCELFRQGRRLKIIGRSHSVFMFSIDGNYYFSGWNGMWKPVPDHVKLRLMTEGKEDLI